VQSSDCLQALAAGQVVAIPTDTYFALACDAFCSSAVARIRKLKQRDPGRPFPLLIHHELAWERIGCHKSPLAQELVGAFWPGKLTLIVPCHGKLSENVGRPGDGAVGLRAPGGEGLQALLAAWDGPLVGTSANISGRPPAKTPDEVETYFPAAAAWVATEHAPGGKPSTVVDVCGDRLLIEREGSVTRDQLRNWQADERT
jgi:L-threonylcarbamoyladenylate synthase